MSRVAYSSTRPMTAFNPVILLIIDPQIDFHEGGSLAVRGATRDSMRISDLIKKHKKSIDEIYVTMDSHHRNHIAHGVFWNSSEDGKGSEPEPFAQIPPDAVGKHWFPRDMSLYDHCKKYTTDLSNLLPKRVLTIWPEHCLIGSVGNCLVDSINDALNEWNDLHMDQDIHFIHKGMNCLTEMYSAIRADVPNADPLTHENVALQADLCRAQRLLICGQALSHCVNYSTRDIVRYWSSRGKDLRNIYVLKDGCSPVTGFEEDADNFLRDMAKLGVTVTTCVHALESLGTPLPPLASKQPSTTINLQTGGTGSSSTSSSSSSLSTETPTIAPARRLSLLINQAVTKVTTENKSKATTEGHPHRPGLRRKETKTQMLEEDDENLNDEEKDEPAKPTLSVPKDSKILVIPETDSEGSPKASLESHPINPHSLPDTPGSPITKPHANSDSRSSLDWDDKVETGDIPSIRVQSRRISNHSKSSPLSVQENKIMQAVPSQLEKDSFNSNSSLLVLSPTPRSPITRHSSSIPSPSSVSPVLSQQLPPISSSLATHPSLSIRPSFDGDLIPNIADYHHDRPPAASGGFRPTSLPKQTSKDSHQLEDQTSSFAEEFFSVSKTTRVSFQSVPLSLEEDFKGSSQPNNNHSDPDSDSGLEIKSTTTKTTSWNEGSNTTKSSQSILRHINTSLGTMNPNSTMNNNTSDFIGLSDLVDSEDKGMELFAPLDHMVLTQQKTTPPLKSTTTPTAKSTLSSRPVSQPSSQEHSLQPTHVNQKYSRYSVDSIDEVDSFLVSSSLPNFTSTSPLTTSNSLLPQNMDLSRSVNGSSQLKWNREFLSPSSPELSSNPPLSSGSNTTRLETHTRISGPPLSSLSRSTTTPGQTPFELSVVTPFDS